MNFEKTPFKLIRAMALRAKAIRIKRYLNISTRQRVKRIQSERLTYRLFGGARMQEKLIEIYSLSLCYFIGYFAIQSFHKKTGW